MMSQINAPIYSYKKDQRNPHPYYRNGNEKENPLHFIFYLVNETSYDNLEPISLSSSLLKFFSTSFFNQLFLNEYFQYLQTNCLFVCLVPNSENLAVQPNPEKSGSPNPPTNKKIILSSFEYDLLNKHVKCSDLQMGAVHSILSGMDSKFIKVCTTILFIIMTLALKVLVLFTISMGTLFLENALFIYGWMPAHMALVTAVAIFLVNIFKVIL